MCRTYTHTHIHAYIHTYIHTYIHAYIHFQAGDSDVPTIPTLIFGTVNGVIGIVASLPKEEFDFMLKVQTALNQVRNRNFERGI
jgi:DNA damage-binding protein 1